MAFVTGSETEYQTARDFKSRCLGQGESLLRPGSPLWTSEDLATASERLLAKDDRVGGNYMERMFVQLSEPASPPAIYQLIAEAMILYYLFPASTIMRTATKIDRVSTVLSWASIKGLDERLAACFGTGIGNVGTHYLSAQPYLMNFFLIFALDGKAKRVDFDDRLECQELADEIRSRTKHVIEARHALLHIMFPEYYEAIVSDSHKKKIVDRYQDLAPTASDIDTALSSIRIGLTDKLGHAIHYYDTGLRKDWDIKESAVPGPLGQDSIPSSVQILLPYLQLIADGDEHKESDLLDSLAVSFSTSSVDRDRRLASGSERVFDNRVRWAKVQLRQAKLLEILTDGYVIITERGKELLVEEPSELTRAALRRYPEYVEFERGRRNGAETPRAGNVWIEKTIVEKRPDRQAGQYAVGRAIWSPQRDAAEHDSYRFMREVRPGDFVLHLTDNRGITGVSVAASAVEEFQGVSGTPWGDRPCYVVRLRDYRALEPPLLKETFFAPPYRERLVDIRKRERNLFYTEGVRVEGLRSLEGFYLTPAPAELVATLNDAYTDLTGQELLSTPASGGGTSSPVAFSFDDLLQTTLWGEAELNELLDAFSADASCKQVILTGPPGTGKTWVAMQIIKYLTNADDSRWRLIQLHPSYSYEQFVEGLRPVAIDGAITFKPVKGLLLDMVDRCRSVREPHFLVMDEMNRANLPRVLGELLYLFEYRQAKIDLPYTRDFVLPENLYFIGTMNTADRSIRSIDAALRRRVEIFECAPSRRVLEEFYKTNTNQVEDLLAGFDLLNATLEEMLDRHHTVGHTFFMAKVFSPTALRIAWKRKIRPLIEEYFFDRAAELKMFEIEAFWPSLA